MLFGKGLMDKVVSGEKTVTRRVGDDSLYKVGHTYTATDRSRWAKKGTPYRKCLIEIVSNHQMFLDAITDADAKKEGFDSREDFKRYWTQHLRLPWKIDLIVWRIEFKKLEDERQ